jgi:hypothetical protein
MAVGMLCDGCTEPAHVWCLVRGHEEGYPWEPEEGHPSTLCYDCAATVEDEGNLARAVRL